MDCIDINDIKAYGYVGFFPEEQKLGQWFCADLKLWLDLRPAAQQDDLNLTIDYVQVIKLTKQKITHSKVALIETLASDIATEILQMQGIQSVEIKLTKMAAPIPDFSGTVAVYLKRSRSEV